MPADAKAVKDAIDQISGANVGGLTSEEKTLILALFKNAAYSTTDIAQKICTQLETIWNTNEEDSDGTDDSNSGENTHTHSYTSELTTAATCTTTGIKTFTCSCGNSYTEVIQATGHNYADGICIVCGAVDPDYDPSIDETDTYIPITVAQNTGAVNRNIYSDDGTTLVQETTFNSWAWISDEIFDVDTEVKFNIINNGSNNNLSIFVGSTTSSYDESVYFAEGVTVNTAEKTITVKAGHKAILVYSSTYLVTVTMEANIVRCTGISLSADDLTFDGLGSQTLTATVVPNNCTEILTWKSSNTYIATVENGVITAHFNGKATITATCGGYSASCSVSVSGIEAVPPCPFTDGTCTVVDNAGVTVGKITISNGNHVNMTRTYNYNCLIPVSNLPESTKMNSLSSTIMNQNKIFTITTGDVVRTVVTFSDSNAHTAGLSVRFITANATTATEVVTSITESGEYTYTMEADLDVGGIGVYLETSAVVADFEMEIYINNGRYV